MGIVDSILEKYGLKYEELSAAERETLSGWTHTLENTQLTLDAVRQFVHSLRDNIEQELVKVGHESKQDIFLKARLRNIMLLEAFLSSPEKAKQAIERQMAGIVSNKK